MWKLRPFVPNSVRRLGQALREERERADRLEIETRRQALRLNELATDVERLSDRLCAAQGRAGGLLGGRPRKAPPGRSGQMTLADIAPGDKESMREYFRLNPPRKGSNDETEH